MSDLMKKNVLHWRNIDIKLPYKYQKFSREKDRIIINACGSIESEVLAIMDEYSESSSTLLNVFAGQIPSGSETTGEILINGCERDEQWPRHIGYFNFNQKISFSSTLTVQQLKILQGLKILTFPVI